MDKDKLLHRGKIISVIQFIIFLALGCFSVVAFQKSNEEWGGIALLAFTIFVLPLSIILGIVFIIINKIHHKKLEKEGLINKTTLGELLMYIVLGGFIVTFIIFFIRLY